jgi:hypothetical protein
MVERSKPKRYFPKDVIYGFLACHCADETGSIAGGSTVKPGDKVEFKTSPLHKFYLDKLNINLNDILKGWAVLDVLDDEKSGYLGNLYIN